MVSPLLIFRKEFVFYGSVDNPVIGKRVKPAKASSPYERLQELEQALEMMKYAYYSGDYSPFVKFAYENKKVAIATVSKRLGISILRLQDFWDYGVEIFLQSLKEMKFTSLKPVMNYYCTCLKYGYLRNKDKSLPVIESIISDSPIPRKKKVKNHFFFDFVRQICGLRIKTRDFFRLNSKNRIPQGI